MRRIVQGLAGAAVAALGVAGADAGPMTRWFANNAGGPVNDWHIETMDGLVSLTEVSTRKPGWGANHGPGAAAVAAHDMAGPAIPNGGGMFVQWDQNPLKRLQWWWTKDSVQVGEKHKDPQAWYPSTNSTDFRIDVKNETDEDASWEDFQFGFSWATYETPESDPGGLPPGTVPLVPPSNLIVGPGGVYSFTVPLAAVPAGAKLALYSRITTAADGNFFVTGLHAIPEPASLGLLVLGALGVALRRGRGD